MSCLWKRKISLPKFWSITLNGVAAIGPVFLGSLSFCTGISRDDDWWVYRAAVVLTGITVIAFLVLKIVEISGNEQKEIVDCLLRRLGSEIWEKSPSKLIGSIEQHRITLFQLKKRNFLAKLIWPQWTHTLCPRTRAPQSGSRPRRKFKVHHHRVENCEGIAGVVFAKGEKSVVTPTLPDLHAEGVVPDESYIEYAKLSNDTVEIVKAERYYSRVIGGVTIYKNGERWGVLILDSSDPDAMSHDLEGLAVKRTLGILTDILP